MAGKTPNKHNLHNSKQEIQILLATKIALAFLNQKFSNEKFPANVSIFVLRVLSFILAAKMFDKVGISKLHCDIFKGKCSYSFLKKEEIFLCQLATVSSRIIFVISQTVRPVLWMFLLWDC